MATSRQQTPIWHHCIMMIAIALLAGLLLASMHAFTERSIARNTHQALLKRLNQLLDEKEFDNDLYRDSITVLHPLLGHQPQHIYFASRQHKRVATLITVTTDKGYNGAITLLVGVYANGQIAGVTTLSQQETPGLGDKIDPRKSNWLENFSGRSLLHPSAQNWAVRQDGGAFDTWTGATITPRAVVSAIHNALLFFEQEKDGILNAN